MTLEWSFLGLLLHVWREIVTRQHGCSGSFAVFFLLFALGLPLASLLQPFAMSRFCCKTPCFWNRIGGAMGRGNGVWRSNLTAMYNMCGSALIDRHSVYYDR